MLQTAHVDLYLLSFIPPSLPSFLPSFFPPSFSLFLSDDEDKKND